MYRLLSLVCSIRIKWCTIKATQLALAVLQSFNVWVRIVVWLADQWWCRCRCCCFRWIQYFENIKAQWQTIDWTCEHGKWFFFFNSFAVVLVCRQFENQSCVHVHFSSLSHSWYSIAIRHQTFLFDGYLYFRHKCNIQQQNGEKSKKKKKEIRKMMFSLCVTTYTIWMFVCACRWFAFAYVKTEYGFPFSGFNVNLWSGNYIFR